MKKARKWLSLLICLVFVLSLCPLGALADGGDDPAFWIEESDHDWYYFPTHTAEMYTRVGGDTEAIESYQWEMSADEGANWAPVPSNWTGSDSYYLYVYATNQLDGNLFRCVITGYDGETAISDPLRLIIRKPLHSLDIWVTPPAAGEAPDYAIYDQYGNVIEDVVGTLGCDVELDWNLYAGAEVFAGGTWNDLYINCFVYDETTEEYISEYYFDTEDFTLTVNGEEAWINSSGQDAIAATAYPRAPEDNYILDFRQGDVVVSGAEAQRVLNTLEAIGVSDDYSLPYIYATVNGDDTVWYSIWEDSGYVFSMVQDEDAGTLTFHFLEEEYDQPLYYEFWLYDDREFALLAEEIPYYDNIIVIPGWDTLDTITLGLTTPNAGEDKNAEYWGLDCSGEHYSSYSNGTWLPLVEEEWGLEMDWNASFNVYEAGTTYALYVNIDSDKAFIPEDVEYIVRDSRGREAQVSLYINRESYDEQGDYESYGLSNWDHFLILYTVADNVWISSDPEDATVAAGSPPRSTSAPGVKT